MKTTNQFVDKQRRSIGLLCLLSVLLLGARIKLTHEFFMLFLIWNLFLAFIPWLISQSLDRYISQLQRKELKWSHHGILLGATLLWLAFLPNAPYIITDLIHIRHIQGPWLIYEILMIASFGITGTYLAFQSLREIQIILQWAGWLPSHLWKRMFSLLVLCLCSLGIYIGRVLRYNSWDLITQPQSLLRDMVRLIGFPRQNLSAWLMIASMSLFLCLSFIVFQKQTTHHDTSKIQ
ncbi:DUF1361 domain-containing protein [Nonlabens xiamenensis]|uniref:DUF1361 domain-containing protein n=1 Tax=Nonlabens xiamenensis TaxID=2341043 RepID=UPI001F0C69F0|nr:DUF1361 domain-containing protein [Nonlabens xiamenensis]